MSKLATAPVEPAIKPDYTQFTPDTMDLEAIIDGREPAPKPDDIEPAPPGPVTKEAVLETEDDFDVEARPSLSPIDPAPPKVGRPPNAAMREQLTTISAQKKQLEADLLKEKEDRAKAVADWEAEKAAREATETRYQEFVQKQGAQDLSQHPSIREIAKPWEDNFNSVCDELEDEGITDARGKQKIVLNLASEYATAKADQDAERGQEDLRRIRDRVAAEFGDNSTSQMMRLIRDGAGRLVQVRQKMEELQRNYPEVEYETNMTGFRSELEAYTKLDSASFNPDATLEAQDPFHPSVILRNLLRTSPEISKSADNATKFSRRAMLPPPPINPAELAPLDATQRQAYIQAHNDRTEQSRKHLAKILPEALVARQILPSLFERLSMLEKIVGGERQVTRGKSIVDDEPVVVESDDEDDIKKFVPRNPELEKFEREGMGR